MSEVSDARPRPAGCHDAAHGPRECRGEGVRRRGLAAGGRRGVELVVVHRPRYDDWSLPKGKLDPGESWEEAALREVDEEVGLRCRLGAELPPVAYTRPEGSRQGRPLLAHGAGGRAARFTPNDEVDEMRWVDPGGRGGAAELPARRRARARGAGAAVNRDRFPGLAGGWARLDGPAGTQMVDVAIEAMAEFMRSGRNANHGGVFAAAHATDECVERARAAVARLLGAEPAGVAFGPSMTAMTMRLSRRGRAHARPGRRGRRHAPGPRRERAAVGDRGRARGRHRPLGGARPRDAGAARVGGRGRPLRPHALGRRHGGVERHRDGARARGDHRRRARGRRAHLARRGRAPRRIARSRSPRSAPTRSPARPTSGTARTSGSSAPRPRCSRSSGRTS